MRTSVDATPIRPARPPRPAVVLPAAAAPHLRTLRGWLGGVLALYATVLQLSAAIGKVAWEWPAHVEVRWSVVALAVAALRAVPLGYFAAFGVRHRRAVRMAGIGAALVEVAFQSIDAVAGRAVHLMAPAAAAGGALAGAVGFLVVGAWMRARAVNDAAILAPDLPLVGAAYLATPLLWLAADAEASATVLHGGWCTLLIALFGASLLASARASRGSAGGGMLVHGAVAAAWCAVGMAPLLAVAPARTAFAIAAVAAFAAVHPLLLGMRGRERRAEGPALRRALPFLLVYLVLSALAPLSAARAGVEGSWLGWVAIESAAAPAGWAEPIALFAVLGYVLAELRGRREEAASVAWHRLARLLAPAAVAVSALRVAALHHAGSTPMRLVTIFLVATAGAMVAVRIGMSLYAVQRGYARAHARRGIAVGRLPVAAHSRSDGRSPTCRDPFARWAPASEPAIPTT